jgi:hypothetical protein
MLLLHQTMMSLAVLLLIIVNKVHAEPKETPVIVRTTFKACLSRHARIGTFVANRYQLLKIP